MIETDVKHGSCLCGGVTLKVEQFQRQVLGCHCRQCRKQSGSYVMAASAYDVHLVVEGHQDLTWYAASDTAKRGFCSKCGSLLFWKMNGSVKTSIMAGCLEDPTGLTMIGHIFTADKGDYYTLDDGVRQFSGSGK